MTAAASDNLVPPSPANSSADSSVGDLVARARDGDRQAWDALVERYAPLIWSICRRHRLGRADADDVGQSVWLRLLDQLDRVREPAALPGWLSTTTRRECLRVLSAAQGPHATIYALDVESLPDQRTGTADQELLAAERHAALRAAFTQLPPNGQQLTGPAHRGPAHALRRHQRPAGHPRRQHRPDPQPLPRQDPPPPRHRRPRQHLRGRSALRPSGPAGRRCRSAPPSGGRHRARPGPARAGSARAASG